jgi:structural maintenance of chromosome 4
MLKKKCRNYSSRTELFVFFQERTKNAQFIIISLRNNMFELADRLVGIFKTDDCTKSVTINPPLFAARKSMIQAET